MSPCHHIGPPKKSSLICETFGCEIWRCSERNFVDTPRISFHRKPAHNQIPQGIRDVIQVRTRVREIGALFVDEAIECFDQVAAFGRDQQPANSIRVAKHRVYCIVSIYQCVGLGHAVHSPSGPLDDSEIVKKQSAKLDASTQNVFRHVPRRHGYLGHSWPL